MAEKEIQQGPRIVEVRRYGNEGLMPVYRASCPFNGDVGCHSSSGSSMCGGFHGRAFFVEQEEYPTDQIFIRCIEPLKARPDVLENTTYETPPEEGQ